MASVYQTFEKDDILSTTVISRPLVTLTSGTSGWRGNVMNGPSGSSISLFEGVRARSDVFPGSTSGISIYPSQDTGVNVGLNSTIFITGSYPATGSVNIVVARTSSPPQNPPIFGQTPDSYETDQDWYVRHWTPVQNLFPWYQHRVNADYFTGSYDYYSLYLYDQTPFQAPCILFAGNALPYVTSSFTMTARIKPTELSESFHNDFTIMSQMGRWKFYITGSNGGLAFTDYHTFVTSSVPLSLGIWQHVAVSVYSGSVFFLVDANTVSSASYTGSLAMGTASYFAVGAEFVTSGTGVAANNGYTGFIYETQVWNVGLTQPQITRYYDTTLAGPLSTSANLSHYARFNDGPLGTLHGFAQGSGALDYTQYYMGNQFQSQFQMSFGGFHGQFVNFGLGPANTPFWQPNDDITFIPMTQKILGSAGVFRVIHLPRMFYGRQVSTGSIRIVCNAYDNQGLQRVICDNGRGGLYISGSITRAFSGEEYTGVQFNKVGNVFYSEGFIVITDPSMLDIGNPYGDWIGDTSNLAGQLPIFFPFFFDTGDLNPAGGSGSAPDLLQFSYRGETRTPVTYLNCRLPPASMNASSNPSYTVVQPNPQTSPGSTYGKYSVSQAQPTTYVTAIGIYNEFRELVAVAKLASPIRKREKDRENIRLRMDF
jgi:hypothetical protein